MSTGLIRKAFNDIVRAYGVSKGYPVILENITASPVIADGPYLKTFILPAPTTARTLGGDHKRFIGVYQITIVIPADQGTGLVTQISKELQALFPVFGSVSYDPTIPGNVVTITSPLSEPSGTVEDGAYYTPTSFTYRSDIN